MSLQDEHAEQLRATAFLAALVAGFDLVALVQFGFTASTQDFGVLLCFGITNSLTVRPPGRRHKRQSHEGQTYCELPLALLLLSVDKHGAA